MKHQEQSLGFVLLVTLVATVLAACASDDVPENGGSTETTVLATLDEWSITVDQAGVPTGDVTFDVVNAGTIPHELVIIRSDENPDSLPVEGSMVPEDQVDVVGEVEEFPAGQSESGTFTLTAGSYILICNIPAHYEQGMYLGFTVE